MRPASTALPRSGRLTQRDVNTSYQKGPSFADLLPWVEYQPDSRTLLLNDGCSVGAVYDITPVGTEGRSQQHLAQIRDTVADALQDSFEERDSHPWVVQFFLSERRGPLRLSGATSGLCYPRCTGVSIQRSLAQ